MAKIEVYEIVGGICIVKNGAAIDLYDDDIFEIRCAIHDKDQPKSVKDIKKFVEKRIEILTDARDNEFKLKEDQMKAQYGITQLEIVKREIEKLDGED